MSHSHRSVGLVELRFRHRSGADVAKTISLQKNIPVTWLTNKCAQLLPYHEHHFQGLEYSLRNISLAPAVPV